MILYLCKPDWIGTRAMPALCGDSLVVGDEACDDGDTSSNDGCSADCSALAGGNCRAIVCGDLVDGSYGTCAPGCVLGARCGDGVLHSIAGESCDAGGANAANTYKANGAGECTTACVPARYCGDGAVTNGEGCDDGVNSGAPGSCKTECSAWVELNGTLDAGEECDDGAANATSGSTCDANCRIRCGNGIKDAALGEECDDGVNDGSYGTCAPGCLLASYCGDGMRNGPEACDQGVGNVVSGYGAGLCTISCQVAPHCGDGRIQPDQGEECDGGAGCASNCRWVDVL